MRANFERYHVDQITQNVIGLIALLNIWKT
jgi:hypothetical protein